MTLAVLSLAWGLVAAISWVALKVRDRQGAQRSGADQVLGWLVRIGGAGAVLCALGLVIQVLVTGTIPASTFQPSQPSAPQAQAARPAAAQAPKSKPKRSPDPPPPPANTAQDPQLTPSQQKARQAVELGREAEQGRNFIEARLGYRRAVGLDPAYAEAWFDLARMEALRMDAAASLEALRSHRALMGSSKGLMDKVRGAADFEPLLIEPDFVNAVEALTRGESADDAIERFEAQAAEQASAQEKASANADPTEADRAPAGEDAPRDFEAIAPVRNDNPAALARELNKRGFKAYKDGDHQAARNLYYQATQVHAASPTPWYNLACMEAMRGDVEGAVVALRRFAQLRPEVNVAQKVRQDRDFDHIRRSTYFQDAVRTLGAQR